MLGVNRRHFLQLSVGTMAMAAWGTGCAAPIAPTAAATPVATATVAATRAADQTETTAGASLLRIALSVLPKSFDPATFDLIEAYPFGFAVYDALIWVDTTLTPQPMLAESWEESTNQLSWLFNLRRNVTFHHGTILTAADVIYTFNRLLDPAVESVLQPSLRFVDTVEAVDDYTVRFLLKAPNADLPFLLAAPQARILAHDYPIAQLLSHPSGTGPFLFVELREGERITYMRNPDYWAAEQIHLEELQHILIPSFDQQIAALVQGAVDLLLDLDSKYIGDLTENPDTKVIEIASGRYQNLVMRVLDPPFNDLRVRQALKACTDRSALRQQILQGRGAIGNDQPVAQISPFFADLPLSPYNPVRARQLLAEAGYPNGLKLQLITANVASGMRELAYAFQALARPAGIEIEVIEIKVPADIYLSEYWGRVPFYVSLSEFRPSIYETFASAYYSWSPWNETGWSSEALDKLLDDACRTNQLDRRKELYQTAQQILQEEGAVIIPYFQPIFSAMRISVQGFQPHPAGWVDLRNVQVVALNKG